MDELARNSYQEINEFLTTPNALRSVFIFFASLVVAYWLSKFLARLIIAVAQRVSATSDNETNAERRLRLRQMETYLSVAIAAIRAIAVAVVGSIAWVLLSPKATGSVAAIGASAFFIVFAGQTLGMLLRDITSGASMIAEKWFTIGDYIKVEPFIDVSGVVEQMNLRSTKLRNMSGEIIWLHNQQIHGVHVTPNGVRTLAVDVFVSDREHGKKSLAKIIDVIPEGPTMLASPLRIVNIEQWGEEMWRITITGQTIPGRDWLIERYFVSAIEGIDKGKEDADKLVVFAPIVRYADPVADRRFRRTVRTMNKLD